MSCAILNIRRATDACVIAVRLTGRCVLNVVHEAVHAFSVSYDNRMKVNVTSTLDMRVNVGIVCTVATANGNEMWWCDAWRVLWNNGVKALWRN